MTKEQRKNICTEYYETHKQIQGKIKNQKKI